jgi:hypothetical protein
LLAVVAAPMLTCAAKRGAPAQSKREARMTKLRVTRADLRIFAVCIGCLLASGFSLHAVEAAEAPKLKEYVDHMQPGEWAEIPNTAVSHYLTKPEEVNPHTWGFTGSASVFYAWTGSAYNSEEMRWYFHGGGHHDYGGNAVYEFDFTKLAWSRLTKPVQLIATPQESCAHPTSGPPASHTYDGIIFVPHSRTIWYWDVGSFCDRGIEVPENELWEFDPTARSWTAYPAPPKGGFPASYIDPNTKEPIFVSTSGDYAIDVAAKTWKKISGGDNIGFPTTVVCDGALWINDWGTFRRWSLDLNLRKIISAAGTNDRRIKGVNYLSGMQCDDASKRLVFWGGLKEVFFYNIADDTWDLFVAKSGTGPTIHGSAGVMSKWIYVRQYDVYAGYNNVDEGVWLFKLPMQTK